MSIVGIECRMECVDCRPVDGNERGIRRKLRQEVILHAYPPRDKVELSNGSRKYCENNRPGAAGAV